MTCTEVLAVLSEYIDGDLDRQTSAGVTEHLNACDECRRELERMRTLKRNLFALPSSISPKRDLWMEIAPSIRAGDAQSSGHHVQPEIPSRLGTVSVVWRVASVLAAAIAGFIYGLPGDHVGWKVQRLVGQTQIEGESLAGAGRIEPGQELRTGPGSTAELEIADIGSALVGPESRLRLVESSDEQHRMHLALGSMHATVWSPPRVFIVETPTATAVDLGCSYDLTVDSSGSARLLVTSGEVSLESAYRWSLVLTGYVCETRSGFGPGTPYLEGSDERLVALLRTFDFGAPKNETSKGISRMVTRDDAVTLMHLLMRTSGAPFRTFFETLSSYYPPPPGVTQEGLLKRDKTMFEAWLNEFAFRIIPLDRPAL